MSFRAASAESGKEGFIAQAPRDREEAHAALGMMGRDILFWYEQARRAKMPAPKKMKARKPKKLAKKTKAVKAVARRFPSAGVGTDPKRVAAILAKLDEAYP